MIKERKETFNEVAKEYERIRPTYPKELFYDIVEYSEIKEDSEILEIGCGTGKATQGFVDLGYKNITCIELGSELAKLTKEKFRKERTIKVYNSSFEEWNEDGSKFDLAISATAFHFINPEVGYPKVARLLDERGSIGFFWTVHVQSYDNLYLDIRKLYKKYAPDLDDTKMPTPEEVINKTKDIIQRTNLFKDLMVKEYSWDDFYTSDEYISLLNTHSRHRLLPKKDREALFKGIKDIIEKYGGNIKKKQLVALFLAKKL
ncbi:methyltransferase type 12 [Caloranaerobacter azorensis H53214]|uniref:Methyltransferase type 12 n=2 Tax=Caloranaerobacter azorensis TaxID=116090 RepID=A0A096BKM9_9FIRM|nr:class I SAM-dependent methyltransferase [Caloranaerobacter azorensis]KGG81323.1 methyltransferase type 12 [Caloranaerobacter azorensis H53214]